MTLKDKYGPCALVTGASSGIGRAFALHLAKEGFDLIIVGRNQTTLQQLATEIETETKAKVQIIQADLGTPQGIQTALTQAQQSQVGLFISSAGFGSSGHFDQLEAASELEMVRVNCNATVQLTHALGKAMLQNKRGGIVLVSSLLGWQGVPLSATYSATKAFVQTFAEALHYEWKPYGVDVVACAPGPVLSNFDKTANMTLATGTEPQEVARQTLAKLGKSTTVIPGRLSKLLTYALLPIPRAWRIPIFQRIMQRLANSLKP